MQSKPAVDNLNFIEMLGIINDLKKVTNVLMRQFHGLRPNRFFRW